MDSGELGMQIGQMLFPVMVIAFFLYVGYRIFSKR